MALNINGTTGISGVDGSASAPAVTGTDSNTGINFASDTVNINTGGSTRATVDSSGTLTATGTSDGVMQLNTSDSRGAFMRFGQGGSYHNMIGCADGITSGDKEDLGLRAADNMIFASGGSTERMRIDSSGRLFINASTTSAVLSGAEAKYFDTGDGCRLMSSRASTAVREHIVFINPNGEIGSIKTSSSSTSFNTSSDYRLKENVVSISDGITRLKTLKPSRFNFIADAETTVDGFLAHEVTAVPEAITGTKDEVDSDSNPVYQGIDQSKLVPLLTAALQEAITKIETLETKVAALEAG